MSNKLLTFGERLVRSGKIKMGSKTHTEAAELVARLLERGMRTEQIAVELEVHNNSVLRWRDGRANPHLSRLKRLRGMVEGM